MSDVGKRCTNNLAVVSVVVVVGSLTHILRDMLYVVVWEDRSDPRSIGKALSLRQAFNACILEHGGSID